MQALISWGSKGDLESYAPSHSIVDMLHPRYIKSYIQDLNVVRRAESVDQLAIYMGRLSIRGEGFLARLIDSYEDHFRVLHFDTLSQSKTSISLQLIEVQRIFYALYFRYRRGAKSITLLESDLHNYFGRFLTLTPAYEIDFLRLTEKIDTFVEMLKDPSEEVQLAQKRLQVQRKTAAPNMPALLRLEGDALKQEQPFFNFEFLLESIAKAMVPHALTQKELLCYNKKLMHAFSALFDLARQLHDEKSSGEGWSSKRPNISVSLLVEQLHAAKHHLECDDLMLALFYYASTEPEPGDENDNIDYRLIIKRMRSVLDLLSSLKQIDMLKEHISLKKWLEDGGAWHRMRLHNLTGSSSVFELTGYEVEKVETLILHNGVQIWRALAKHKEGETGLYLVSSPHSVYHLYTQVLRADAERGFRFKRLSRFGHFYTVEVFSQLQGTEIEPITNFIIECVHNKSIPQFMDRCIWGVHPKRSTLCCLIPPGQVHATNIEIEKYCFFLVNQSGASYRSILKKVRQKIPAKQCEAKPVVIKLLENGKFERQHIKDFSSPVKDLIEESYFSLQTIASERVKVTKKSLIHWYKDVFEGSYIPSYTSDKRGLCAELD